MRNSLILLLAAALALACGGEKQTAEENEAPAERAAAPAEKKATPDEPSAPAETAPPPGAADVQAQPDIQAKAKVRPAEEPPKEEPRPSLFREPGSIDAVKAYIGSEDWRGVEKVHEAFQAKLPEFISAGGSEELSGLVAECFKLRSEIEKAAAEERWGDVVLQAAAGLEKAARVSSVASDSVEFHNAAVEHYRKFQNHREMANQLAQAQRYLWVKTAAMPNLMAYRKLFSLMRAAQASGQVEAAPGSAEGPGVGAQTLAPERLLSNLQTGDAEARHQALKRMKDMGDEASSLVPSLKEMLTSGDLKKKTRAVYAINSIGPPARELVPLLIAELSRPKKKALSYTMVVHALSNLGGPAAMEALKKLSRERKGSERASALRGLIHMSTDMAGFLPELKLALREESKELKSVLPNAIKKLDPSSEEALGLIRSALDAPDWRSRQASLGAIAGLGTKASTLAPELTLAMADPLTRMHAVVALASTDPGSSLAFDTVRYWLRKGSGDQKKKAITAAKAMGAHAAGAAPLLIEALKINDAKTKISAVEALVAAAPGAPGVVPALVSLLEDPVIKVRLAALEALGSLAPLAEESIPVVTQLATMDCAAVRAAAIDAMVRILRERSDRIMTEASADPSPAVRRAVSEAKSFLKEHPEPITIEAVSIPTLPEPSEPDWQSLDTRPWKVELYGYEPSVGKEDALVTIVLFGAALDSPAQSSEVFQTLAGFVDKHPDDVRLVWKALPGIGLDGMQGARALLAAAEQGKFLPYLEALNKDRFAMSASKLKRMAKDIGLDLRKWKASIRRIKKERLVVREQELIRSIGEKFPPRIYVNGRKYQGLVMKLKAEAIATLVEAELEKARRMAASGMPRSDIYKNLVSNGKTRKIEK